MSESSRRKFEMSLEIAAPVEHVWKALTDAEELVRWFPLEAEIEPRVGGRYWISWQNEWQGESRIEIFEPNRHLRTGQPVVATPQPAGPGTVEEQGRPKELAVDYYLEGRAGGTVLRLVHSGFGQEAAWDEEFDGISVGWAFELRSLRHYLEHHRGRDRRVAYLLGPKSELTDPQVWERVLGEGLGATLPAGLVEGDRYSLPVGGGKTFAGIVVDSRPPKQFSGTVEELGNALFRIDVFAARVTLWLADWEGNGDAVGRFQAQWREMLTRVFP